MLGQRLRRWLSIDPVLGMALSVRFASHYSLIKLSGGLANSCQTARPITAWHSILSYRAIKGG